MTKKMLLMALLCANTATVFAALPVDLGQEPIARLRSFLPSPTAASHGSSSPQLKEVTRFTDFNQTLHIRLQQNYLGYPVRGGEAVMHIPRALAVKKQLRGIMAMAEKTSSSSMNGVLYLALAQDLPLKPAEIFNSAQAKKALAVAKAIFGHAQPEHIKNEQSELIVYIDEDNKAHWAFQVSFYVKSTSLRSKPVFILDAESFKIYKKWNEVKKLDNVSGGGLGGNKKMGKVIYDGLPGNLPALTMQRDMTKQICYLANDDVSVADFRQDGLAQFHCAELDQAHNNIYWDADNDHINDGYSPNHDALYAGGVIKNMYQTWYHIPVLVKNNVPMILSMVTHARIMLNDGSTTPENAAWDPVEEKMYFGDGQNYFYPLTSLGVAAHEISHGFTEQNARLAYEGQSGGINESFSDMAAQAAEFFVRGQSSWQIGAEVIKEKNVALRYVDQPSKDCSGLNRSPGWDCSFEHIRDYERYVKEHRFDITEETRYPQVHFSSGIFNRVFYLMSTAPDWNVRKAFDVMTQANRYYWTSTTTFSQAACGVIKATKDYNYDLAAVVKAFANAGLDTSRC